MIGGHGIGIHSQKCHRLFSCCQFYRLFATCQPVSTNLLISLSCYKFVKIKLRATCHLHPCGQQALARRANAFLNKLLQDMLNKFFVTCAFLVVSVVMMVMVRAIVRMVLVVILKEVYNDYVSEWW